MRNRGVFWVILAAVSTGLLSSTRLPRRQVRLYFNTTRVQLPRVIGSVLNCLLAFSPACR